MFLLAIIDDVPCFTHFVFYSCLFILENGIKMISSPDLYTRHKTRDRDRDRDSGVRDRDRDETPGPRQFETVQLQNE